MSKETEEWVHPSIAETESSIAKMKAEIEKIPPQIEQLELGIQETMAQYQLHRLGRPPESGATDMQIEKLRDRQKTLEKYLTQEEHGLVSLREISEVIRGQLPGYWALAVERLTILNKFVNGPLKGFGEGVEILKRNRIIQYELSDAHRETGLTFMTNNSGLLTNVIEMVEAGMPGVENEVNDQTAGFLSNKAVPENERKRLSSFLKGETKKPRFLKGK